MSELTSIIELLIRIEWATWVRPFTPGEWSQYPWLWWMSGLGMALHFQVLLPNSGTLAIPMYPIGFLFGAMSTAGKVSTFDYTKDGHHHTVTVFQGYNGENSFDVPMVYPDPYSGCLMNLINHLAFWLVLGVTYFPLWRGIWNFVSNP